ncbi:MAG: hypothetical protein FJ109_02070 [Deltaproteobacteria bacterium]|nr:hypothetical protein [Deltaproteobacteria bacterium]
MAKRAVWVLAFLAAVGMGSGAFATDLRFDSGKSANLFWMVDQISQWDSRYTSPSYRDYWKGKLEFTDEDYAVLDQYARLRRKLARLDQSEVKRETSPWVSLFGGGKLLPHEKFALAFLETTTVNDAAALLKLSKQEQDIVIGTLLHFARKMKDEYAVETGHLVAFAQKANILITLADAGGFIGQLRSFYGIKGAIPETIPVDVLWAPPGFNRPAHMDYHVILPVSVDHAQTDEAVLQHLSLAMQEVSQYLLTKLPAETLSRAGALLLQECGMVNPGNPFMIRQALQVAVGEVLFLRERFPDLPASPVLSPWDPQLDYPFAVDELARGYAAVLKDTFSQPGGFYPAFVTRAVDVQKGLLPPRPRFFTSTAILFGDKESRALFNGMFAAVDRVEVDIDSVRDFESAVDTTPGRAVFIVVTAKLEGNMYNALKKFKQWGKISGTFRALRNTSFLTTFREPGAGMVYVIRGTDLDAIRQLLLRLYRMEEIPAVPVTLN